MSGEDQDLQEKDPWLDEDWDEDAESDYLANEFWEEFAAVVKEKRDEQD